MPPLGVQAGHLSDQRSLVMMTLLSSNMVRWRRPPVVLICVLIMCTFPLTDGSLNPCPSLNTEVSEDTPVGSVLITFQTTATRISFVPRADSSRFTDYLQLNQTSPNSYQVILGRSLDLNNINPRPPPVPDTNEDLQCNYTRGSTNSRSAVKSIAYSMTCDVVHSTSTVQVTSVVRVAIRDVNDKVPYFLCAPYHKTISEQTPVFSTVFTLRGLAADLDIDSGIAGYNLVSGGDGMFGMSGAASEGYIVLLSQLDYDRGRKDFALNVSTTDTGEPPLNNWTILYLTVADADDQNPTFSHDLYYISLPEQNSSILNHPIRTSPQVFAYDLDYGINATINYAVDSGHIVDGTAYFSVEAQSGQLVPLQELDRGHLTQFVLRIKAYQIDNPENSFSYATLIVNVEDSNGHRPTMSQSRYNITIPENSPSLYRVLQVAATDLDQGSNAKLAFHINDPSGAFDIEAESGLVFVRDSRLLDRESRTQFDFTVHAQETESLERYRSEDSTVHIQIVDVNDNSPDFQPNGSYTFYCNKADPVNTLVGQVKATDLDSEGNGEVAYSLLYGTSSASSRFRLDQASGQIYTQAGLDEPYVSSYILTIQASDQPPISTHSRSSVALVNITVLSGNLHAPVLVGAPYSASISEDMSVGRTILYLQATDGDGDVALSYEISSGDSQNVFLLHSATGVLSLRRHLDREETSTYTLTVAVSDGIHRVTGFVRLTVEDVNDNAPDFQQSAYIFTVTEEQNSGAVVGLIKADDPDTGLNSEVQYTIAGSFAKEYFSLDSRTGQLTTVQTLDREQASQYSFAVYAQDRGVPSYSSSMSVTVVVGDINDNPPQFSGGPYSVKLLEKARPQPFLQLVARDPDYGRNGIVRYRILRGDSELFDINEQTGELSAKAEISLSDVSQPAQYEVEVETFNPEPLQCRDCQNGITLVTITVEDVNDQVPVFTMPEYTAQVYENHPLGTSITRVVAQDSDRSRLNQAVSYWLDSTDDQLTNKFLVESHTGVIRLMQPLDTDQPNSEHRFQLRVMASDLSPSHSTGEIRNVSTLVNLRVLDVNDNTPVFSRNVYRVDIHEDIAVLAMIDDVEAMDLDGGRNGDIVYDLTSFNVPFSIDPESGTVRLTSPLDYESDPHTYSLKLLAVDRGEPQRTGTSTLEVRLRNVNDNDPGFPHAQYEFEVYENMRPGTTLGRLKAVDLDEDLLRYTLLHPSDNFAISNETGEVTTIQVLDREITPSFTLTVIATEVYNTQGQPVDIPHTAQVRVKVKVLDQNDNKPIFTKTKFETRISEGATNKTIMKVQAEDADLNSVGSLRYYMLTGNDQGIFDLEAETGWLWVVRGNQLDYSKQQAYHMVVQVVDAGAPSLSDVVDVNVEVIDINNHPPLFSQDNYYVEVEENLSPETWLLKVLASDVDTNGYITYSMVDNHNGHFTINPDSGSLFTSKPLDRELTNIFHLTIVASDGTYSANTQVIVTVLDRNDNAPMFSLPSYQKSIGQYAAVGSSVMSVIASDMDLGHNAYLSYWLTDSEGVFDINPSSGVIRTVTELGNSKKDVYMMTVFAQDHGVVPLVGNASVAVFVNDTNKHAPQFQKFVYDASITENNTPGQVVIQLQVSDQDEGLAGEVHLEIMSGNQDNLFEVSPQGIISVKEELDYEEERYYELKIQATDQAGNPKSSTAIVHIQVEDQNDNGPEFMSFPGVLNFKNQLHGNDPIYKFAAIDRDDSAGANGMITYTIESHHDKFTIDPISGEMKASVSIGQGVYDVIVRASDQGQPSKKTELTVSIQVVDSSELVGYPVFDQTWYTATIQEDAVLPVQVVDLQASLDLGLVDQGVTYNITGGREQGHFSINSATGEVSLFVQPNPEELVTHSLEVTAYNSEDPSLHAVTVVMVEIQDVNNLRPRFPFSTYTVKVAEDTVVGRTVTSLKALDSDSNSQLQYSLLSSNAGDLFRLTTLENSAVIIVSHPLDHDTMGASLQGTYTLEIGVSDGVFSAATPAQLLIVVGDVNDNSPYFTETSYLVEVPEDAGPCQEIKAITAMDPDTVDDGQLRYEVSEGAFTMGSQSGMLHRSCDPTKFLDRESQDRYSFVVRAMDQVGNLATASVTVIVTDVNDNAPRFVGEPYVIRVTEGFTSSSLLTVVSATDSDKGDGGKVEFNIPTELQDKFSIVSRTFDDESVGELRILSALNREEPGLRTENGSAVYRVPVTATDQADQPLTSTTTVLVYIEDINDNPPHCELGEYEVSISEGTPVGTPILTIRGQDPDLPENTDLSYSIETQTSTGMFSMGRKSGVLEVSQSLDYNQHQQHQVNIKLSDGLYDTTCLVRVHVVDVNNNDPIFSQAVYNFYVMENDLSGETGQLVGQVLATDHDHGLNGEVTYQITSRNARGRFAIQQPMVGNITLVGVVDRETDDHFTLIVTARDKGTPVRMSTCEVEVKIQDANDNPPQFIDVPYTGSVAEHSPPGTTVFVFPAVKAVDSDWGHNAQIQYSLQGPNSQLFRIDPQTGIVTTGNVNPALLDREIQNVWNVMVIASDSQGGPEGLTSGTTLAVTLGDINDHAPTFTHDIYNCTVLEDISSSTLVGQVQASDRDMSPNNRIQYAIMSGAEGKFYIDRISGELFVSGSLDRENRAAYLLNVSASDGGVTPGPMEGFTLVNITLDDTNDNPPVFTQSNLVFHMPEEEDSGHIIGQVLASDEDSDQNAVVFYTFLTDQVPFAIDSNSGQLSTTQKLDREAESQYVLQIRAFDDGNPKLSATVTVTVDVTDKNDHPPEFDQDTYAVTILERSPLDSVVLLPRASDKDAGLNGQITYSLDEDSQALPFFSIDPHTGLIKIAQPIVKSNLIQSGLITNDDGTIHLTIRAGDSGDRPLFGEAVVQVYVGEVSDEALSFNRVMYQASLQEELPEGTSVLEVLATSQNPNTQISYSLINTDHFKLQDSTQGLIVTSGQRLDREIQEVYTFTVRAVDNSTPQRTAFALVSITLEDRNDNSPEFSESEIILHVLEGTTGVFESVTAVDRDNEENGRLSYSIISGNTEDIFGISPSSGDLKALRALDRERIPLDMEKIAKYRLTILAQDGGHPSRNSSVVVLVVVGDLNDNKPEFTRTEYIVSVEENGETGQEVMALLAWDKDAGHNGTVLYELENSGQTQLPFYIQTKEGSCVIYTLGSLDYEVTTSYQFNITARDLGTPSKNSSTQVTISVKDLPDSAPHFENTVYLVKLRRQTPSGTSFYALSAGTGRYNYQIMGGNQAGLFSLNSTSGVLTLLQSLTNQQQALYDIIIQASDFLDPPNTDTAKVRVMLVDEALSPTFSKPAYHVVLAENMHAPQLVVDVDTEEEQAGIPVSYNIISGAQGGIFEVDHSNGRLWMKESLDREEKSLHEVIVSCERVKIISTGPSKRSTSELMSEVAVRVEVDDVNDNTPVFQEDPVVAGVPIDAPFNHIVTNIKVFDADTGNGSGIVFRLTEVSSSGAFYVEPSTGKLRSTLNFANTDQKVYDFKVNATDNWGQGFTVQAAVKVFVLSDNERAVLVARIPPLEFQKRQESLIGNLSMILGWQVKLEKLEPHVTKLENDKSVDVTSTDMYFYAVDMEKGSVVSRLEVMKKITEKSREIAELFRIYEVEAIQPVVVIHPAYTLSKAEIGLIALACLVFFGCFLGVIVMCITWKQHKKQKKKPKRIPLYASMNGHANGHGKPNGLTQLSNPLFVDGEMFNESLEIDRVSMNDSRDSSQFRETESQNLSMDFPAENDPGSMLPQNEFVSSDADGNAVIVVDNEAPQHDRTRGQNHHHGQDAWVRPYVNKAYSAESVRDRGNRVVTTASIEQHNGATIQDEAAREVSPKSRKDFSISAADLGNVDDATTSCIQRVTRRVSPILEPSIAKSYDVPGDPEHGVCSGNQSDSHGQCISNGAKLGSGRYATQICKVPFAGKQNGMALYKDHIYDTIPDDFNYSGPPSRADQEGRQIGTAEESEDYSEIPGSVPSSRCAQKVALLGERVECKDGLEQSQSLQGCISSNAAPVIGNQLVQYSSHLVIQGPQIPAPRGCWDKHQGHCDPKVRTGAKHKPQEMADTFL